MGFDFKIQLKAPKKIVIFGLFDPLFSNNFRRFAPMIFSVQPALPGCEKFITTRPPPPRGIRNLAGSCWLENRSWLAGPPGRYGGVWLKKFPAVVVFRRWVKIFLDLKRWVRAPEKGTIPPKSARRFRRKKSAATLKLTLNMNWGAMNGLQCV